MAKNYATTAGEWVEYVPEFDENREDDDPITVEIQPMTVREAQRRSGNVKAKPMSGGGIRTNSTEIRQETFCTHVRNIRNLMVAGEPVTTAEQLLGTGLGELVAEIEDAIVNISRLDEGDAKNFASRSDGSSAKNTGTVRTATKKNSD